MTLTVQDPATLPDVEIAREKPLPFKPSGNGFGGRWTYCRGRDNDRRRVLTAVIMTNRDDRRDFKRKSNKNRKDFENKDNKRPHRTSSEKKNGFVIRNKGER